MGTDYKSAPAIEGNGTDYKSAPAIEGNGTDYKSAPAILHYFITSTLILKSEIGHVFSIGISLPT
jgi:hypothetical protein